MGRCTVIFVAAMLLLVSASANAITLPSQITQYAPITITNNQGAPYPQNSQIMLTVNSLEYQAYEASNLQNIEFFYSNGTIIPSWLEGNLLDEQQSTNLYTSQNTIYWLRIYPANSFLAADSANTVYIGFATNTANLLSNTITGEAPQLSSSYGQYDDGANVFVFYTNFSGTSVPTGFTTFSTSPSFNNGITFSTSDGGLYYDIALTPNIVIDDLYLSPTVSGSSSYPGTSLYFTTSIVGQPGFVVGPGYSYNYGDKGPDEFSSSAWSSTGATRTSLAQVSQYPTANTVYSYTWFGTNQIAYTNYVNVISSSDSTYTIGNYYPVLADEAGGYSYSSLWFRGRTLPPGGAQAATSLTPAQPSGCSNAPSGIIYCLPITVQNQYTYPYTTNSQIPIYFVASNSVYNSYLTANLMNVEFFYVNGTVIPSWLEGNTVNENVGAGLSSNTVLYWLRIANGASFLPASGSNTLYLGIAANAVDFYSATGNTGAAPQLYCASGCPTTSFAGVDNGNNIFDIYANWQGPTEPIGWNAIKNSGSYTPTWSPSNYIQMMNDVGDQSTVLSYNSPTVPKGAIVEASWEYHGGADDLGIGMYATGWVPYSGGDEPTAYNGYFDYYEFFGSSQAITYDGSSIASATNSFTQGGPAYVYSQITSTTDSMRMNFTEQTTGPYNTPVYSGLTSSASYSGSISDTNNVFYVGASTGGLESNIYLFWLRVRSGPPGNAPPPIVTLTSPSNAILDIGQSETYTATVTNGIGPFTVNLISSGSTVLSDMITSPGGSNTFTFSPEIAGSNTFNVIATDTGSTPVAVFNSVSNTITVANAPTVSISASSTSINTGQSVTFTGNIPSGEGVGSFTFNLIVNGNVIATADIPVNGGSNTLTYTFNTIGTYSANLVATDTGTSTPFVFNSVGASVSVTTPSGSSGGPPATGGRYVQTTQTTTPSTTISLLPTTIVTQPQQIVNKTLTGSMTTSNECTGSDAGTYAITYQSLGSTFVISPGASSCFAMVAINVTTANQTTPSNLTKIIIINFTVNTTASVNATLHYSCDIPSSQIAPYILLNGVWRAIIPFTVNSTVCSVTFVVPADPIIGLFEAPAAVTSIATSTVPALQPQQSSNSNILLIVAAVIIIIIVFFYLRKRKKQ